MKNVRNGLIIMLLFVFNLGCETASYSTTKSDIVSPKQTFMAENHPKYIRSSTGDYIDYTKLVTDKDIGRIHRECINRSVCSLEDWGGKKDVLVIHPLKADSPAMLEITTDIPWEGKSFLVLSVRGHRDGDFDAYVIVRDRDGNEFPLLKRTTIAGNKGWVDFKIPLDNFKGKNISVALYNEATGWQYELCYIDKFYILNSY